MLLKGIVDFQEAAPTQRSLENRKGLGFFYAGSNQDMLEDKDVSADPRTIITVWQCP